MKAFNEYIVCIPEPYHDNIVTESGLKVFIDKRYSIDKSVNRIGTIISSPINLENGLNEGIQVVIDPTILYEQNFHLTNGRQDSVFMVNKEKRYYKVNPGMIVLYRENEEMSWKGYLNNSLFEAIKEEEKIKTSNSGIILEVVKKAKECRAKLVYGNNEILEDISIGEEVLVNDYVGIPFLLEGKEYIWYKNEDVLGLILN